jgi:hypothetical protein
MQSLPFVTRKLTLLATMLVMPGGLMLLLVVALALVAWRTERGRRALMLLKPRIPARVKAPIRKILVLASWENVFPLPPTQAPSA